MCGVVIDGYVVTIVREEEKKSFCYRELPVISFEEFLKVEDAGIILGLSDKHYNNVIPMFREKVFSDYFMMTEYNKRAIAEQVRPRNRDELTFEISLADHCNLSCQMCDHFSQLSKPWFVDMK